MIDMNADPSDLSLVAKGRELLDRGELSAAMQCYGQAFDPDSADEAEARNMLIEARSHLSRKHPIDALECFEEALVMGTEVQRRQALEGITAIAEIRARLRTLTPELKKKLKERLGKRSSLSSGLALVSDDENILLISHEAAESLPLHLVKGGRISRIPPHISEERLPFKTNKCIPYTDEGDVHYILAVAAAIVAPKELADED
jgi:hypothetical protein